MSNTTTKAEAKRILEPHFEAFVGIYKEALRDVTAILNTCKQPLYPRLKSGLLHNFATNKADVYFTNNKDDKIVVVKKYGTLLVLFDNKLAIRFKKINNKNLSSNVPTFRSSAIIGQQLTIYGEYPVPTYIDLGYQIDVTWSKFERIAVVCRDKKNVAWFFEINARSSDVIYINTPDSVTPELKTEEKQLKIKGK